MKGVSATATGNIRDIGPAVRRTLPSFDMTHLAERGSPQDGEITYELVGLRGEPGLIRFTFDPASGLLADLRTPRAITVQCVLGRFGDPPRERDLARRIAGELRALAREE